MLLHKVSSFVSLNFMCGVNTVNEKVTSRQKPAEQFQEESLHTGKWKI